MKIKVLIVEDQFIEANNLQMILERASYHVLPIAHSVPVALDVISQDQPDLVLLDIYLKGNLTGIDLARVLRKKNIAFVYLSANSTKDILEAAKSTQPYGFLVKPFREKDVLVTLDIAQYLHEQKMAAIVSVAPPQVPHSTSFPSIIGNSPALSEALDKVAIASPSDISVLILGESGTGKEKIAESIHNLSPRKMQPYIRVNCAALPASLIESELFGHEKGAFTGALDRRIGKFERANNGTIFLDEIGEMPLDMQVKLLHVLQEREIERVGGKAVIKVNVRVIAATNRNLEKEVAEGKFRIDLYYRLNVFPIRIPPLRERKEDVPALAMHFLRMYASKFKKRISGFSDQAALQMQRYDWPGNIRELQHLVERSVLMCTGDTISRVGFEEVNGSHGSAEGSGAKIKSIDENERDYITEILRRCNGRISGKDGAAELLGINVSTLNSRIKKLGIGKNIMFKP
ncbi:sigma-54 dependent transcriptional regulator [Dyadobacter sp. CY343]|uniref:sigma-54-dependent transcriptional regulator n=1 Tax=Dyadobacter sp. CY343 TaxID=2907299 RepID=UPI001F47DA90|nr:sigma-54 dependent transcriptional regulator [Dyadobacter sp. CY343]MCE7060222.1 sigma-54 dependent transcriptional regulator [Dyadobacter sp. CY343]